MRRRIRKWPHIMKSSNALHVVFHVRVRKQGKVPSEIQRKSVWAGANPIAREFGGFGSAGDRRRRFNRMASAT